MANAAISTQFHYRDYFNEIRWQDKSWEVAHPAIFRQLVSRREKQWHWIDPDKSEYLEGLYYTVLKQTTPFGLAEVWVCCEDPKMFDFPKAPYDETLLWNWWLKWGQAAILISSPILTNPDTHNYKSWDIRSKPYEWTTPQISTDWLPSYFQYFFTKGCYTIASGLTLIMALHREDCIPSYQLLSLLQTSRQQRMPNIEEEYLLWFVDFNIHTWKMITYVHTNTLVGDYLMLYAMYGNTSPVILSYLLEQQHRLTPVFSYLIEDVQQPMLISAVFNTYYMRLLSAPLNRKSPLWYSYWKIIQPYLFEMSLSSLRESPMYEQPVRIHTPNRQFYNNLMDIYAYLSDKRPFLDYVEFIQREYQISDYRMVYYLFAATFNARVPKASLYAYWSFVRENYFSTKEEWMRWVCRLMVFYSHRQECVIPWRFFHWLFSEHPLFTVSLFEPYYVLYGHELYNKSLYHYFDLFQNHPYPLQIPYMYKTHVLLPRIQSRIRVLHQFKQMVPADIGHVFEDYLMRHRDFIWQ